MKKVYTVARIEEPDYGCEERPEGTPYIDKVYLIDEDNNETCVEVDDSILYKRNIDEGTMVEINQTNEIHKVQV